MSLDSTFEDIEGEISSWGYSISLSDYDRSLQSEESAQLKMVNTVGAGRGRGITDSNYMANVRLASEISELKAHTVPMGYLPTTEDVLKGPPEYEITSLLRRLGISGHDGEISSRKTRQMPKHEKEIHIDGNLPVILNGDLFNTTYDIDSDATISEDDEPYDPSKPLDEQFRTIKEFALSACGQESHYKQKNASASSCPESASVTKSMTCDSSFDLLSDSSPANDDSSSSTSATTYSAGEQNSNEMSMEPLLVRKTKVYTPRQLYELKKMPQQKVNLKVKSMCPQ